MVGVVLRGWLSLIGVCNWDSIFFGFVFWAFDYSVCILHLHVHE
jgi:hypothetical protein